MTILVTGSIGKISSRVASQLSDLNLPFIVATRRNPSSIPFPSVKFDWLDPSTYTNPFQTASDISSIFIVPPEIQEPAPYVNAFIDLAITHGVSKFVLSAGTSAAKDGPFAGPIWAYLEKLAATSGDRDLGAGKGVQFAVLRPTWFNENFSELQHVKSIRDESVIYSAAEDGRMPFISCADIAACSVHFLSGAKVMQNRDYVLLGPELWTHDEVAKMFSEVLGREIKHVRKDMEQMVEQYQSVGMNALYANFIPYLEVMASGGSEEKLFDDGVDETEKLLGRKGMSLRDWVRVEAEKGFWA